MSERITSRREADRLAGYIAGDLKPITEQELEAMEARAAQPPYAGHEAAGTGLHNAYLRDVPRLIAEVRRLRGLFTAEDVETLMESPPDEPKLTEIAARIESVTKP
jgi:hypothetical protein